MSLYTEMKIKSDSNHAQLPYTNVMLKTTKIELIRWKFADTPEASSFTAAMVLKGFEANSVTPLAI